MVDIQLKRIRRDLTKAIKKDLILERKLKKTRMENRMLKRRLRRAK